jgi:hypothetical protein
VAKRNAELKRMSKRLRAWFEADARRSQRDMSRALSVTESTVSLWCSGDRCPSGRFPEDIETYTDGDIEAAGWPRKTADSPVRKFVPAST